MFQHFEPNLAPTNHEEWLMNQPTKDDDSHDVFRISFPSI